VRPLVTARFWRLVYRAWRYGPPPVTGSDGDRRGRAAHVGPDEACKPDITVHSGMPAITEREPDAKLTDWARGQLAAILADNPGPGSWENGRQLAYALRAGSPHPDTWLAGYLLVIRDYLLHIPHNAAQGSYAAAVSAIAMAAVELTELEDLDADDLLDDGPAHDAGPG
jgi:hypothetical protein